MSSPAQPLPVNAPGLFTFHDFIRPGEDCIYAELDESLRRDLAPSGILEHNLVDEIRRAMWRLRRCGLVEENLNADALVSTGAAAPGDDPMQDEARARIQLTVDRARSQAHRLLHKCTAELRKLQSERIYRNESLEAGTDISSFGICDWPLIHKTLERASIATCRRRKLQQQAELDAFLTGAIPPPADPGSFCKNIETPAPTRKAA